MTQRPLAFGNVDHTTEDVGHQSVGQPNLAAQEEGEGGGKRRAMVPMTRAEAEVGQDKITNVWDEDTGRWRLIRGDGEIIERIVSQAEHR